MSKTKIIQMKGLPGSGKSTWAKELVLKDHTFKRINRDDIRAMVDNRDWSQAREKHIIAAEKLLAEYFVSQGFNLIIDDTGFSDSQQKIWQDFAKEHDADLEINFINTPIDECIARDIKRAYGVGEKVIKEMHRRYISEEKVPEAYEPPKGKPFAIMCDIDGTLAHMNGKRGPFDWKKVGLDDIDTVVRGILLSYKDAGHSIVLLSGRDSVCRAETEEWLIHWGVPYESLFMRPEGDNRKDSIVKRELFDEHIRDNYRIDFVLDDRDQVVEMWRGLGLKVLQVEDGDF